MLVSCAVTVATQVSLTLVVNSSQGKANCAVNAILVLFWGYSLFGRIEDASGCNFGDDLFRGSLDLLICTTFHRNATLFFVVVQNQRHILALDAGGQTVLVVVPEQVQQVREADHRWIVMNFNHLGVITPVIDDTEHIY